MPNYHHPFGRSCVRADLAKNRGRPGEVERIQEIDGPIELRALGQKLERLSRACRSRAKHPVGEQIPFADELTHAAGVLAAARGERALLVRDALVVAGLRVPENKKRPHTSMVCRVAPGCNPLAQCSPALIAAAVPAPPRALNSASHRPSRRRAGRASALGAA